MSETIGFNDAISYYSIPNKYTGETIPGIPEAPILRENLVKQLALADHFLRTNRHVQAALGQNVRIKIIDAFRPYEAQKYAYEVYWPIALKTMHPDWTDETVQKHLPDCCAKPEGHPTPTPHQTGGAVDVQLWGLDDGKRIDLGYKGTLKETAFPDFYEVFRMPRNYSEEERKYRNTVLDLYKEHKDPFLAIKQVTQARRVLYYAMMEYAGLTVNPHEIWHFDLGDPLWGHMSGQRPYYGLPILPAWYKIG